MTAQELKDLIAKKEKQAINPSVPESAKVAIKKQIEDMKSQLDALEKAEGDIKSAGDDEKKIEKTEDKLEKEEKKAEKKVEEAEKEIKKAVKKGMTEAQKRAAEKYRQKQKEKKEADKKKKEASEKKAIAEKKKRAKKPTKVEAKTKRKAKPAPAAKKAAPKKAAPKKDAPKAKRKKRASKKDTISSFLAKNKTAKAKYKGVSMESKRLDADKPAKPFGYRLAGTNRRPTKAEIKAGKAYWEGRPTKADVRRTGYPKLESGGSLDKIVGSPNDPELLAGGSYFAKGGGIFNLGGGDGRGNRSHHQEGRAWTLDHYQHNKAEKYEKPLRNRVHKKKKYDEGGEIIEQDIEERETTVIDKPQTKSETKSTGKSGGGAGEAGSGAGEVKDSMWLVLLKDSDGDEVFEVVSAEDEDDAYEQAEKLNKGSKATGIKLLIDESGKNTMFKRGGKVKGRKSKYTYLPQHEIAYITTWDGVIIDAEDILDGAYIRGRRKFEEGGQVWSGSAEGVEGAGMFAGGGGVEGAKYVYIEKDIDALDGTIFYSVMDADSDETIQAFFESYEDAMDFVSGNNYVALPKYHAKGGSVTENPYKYAKDKAQGLVSKAKDMGGFKKGGRVKRSKGNGKSGAAWTLDHYQHNKREDYEVPMRERKHKR